MASAADTLGIYTKRQFIDDYMAKGGNELPQTFSTDQIKATGEYDKVCKAAYEAEA